MISSGPCPDREMSRITRLTRSKWTPPGGWGAGREGEGVRECGIGAFDQVKVDAAWRFGGRGREGEGVRECGIGAFDQVKVDAAWRGAGGGGDSNEGHSEGRRARWAPAPRAERRPAAAASPAPPPARGRTRDGHPQVEQRPKALAQRVDALDHDDARRGDGQRLVAGAAGGLEVVDGDLESGGVGVRGGEGWGWFWREGGGGFDEHLGQPQAAGGLLLRCAPAHPPKTPPRAALPSPPLARAPP
jgi:hypothetical protein